MEQFCILASTQKGRACAALIQQAISHRKLFNFGELLEIPSVQQLNTAEGENSDLKKAFNTLELFAYGTYLQYKGNSSAYVNLTPHQLTKLRQLTVVSICADKKVVPYDLLFTELGMGTDQGAEGGSRELEDLLVDAMYSGLLSGKIDQHGEALVVREVHVARDVRPEDVAGLLAKLVAWRAKCSELCAAHQGSTQELKEFKAAETAGMAALLADVQRVQKAVQLQLQESGDAGGDEWMDRDYAGGPASYLASAGMIAGASQQYSAKRSRAAGSSLNKRQYV